MSRAFLSRIVTVAPFLLAMSVVAQEQPTSPAAVIPEVAAFDEWLAGVRSEATATGIRAETVAAAFANVTLQDAVIERDRAQPEFVLDFDAYVKRRLTPATVAKAQRLCVEHRELLQSVSAAYGVQPRFLVAIWGIESQFGVFRGVRPTIPTLATLAFKSRRAEFFRTQLLAAIRIVDRGDIALADLKGSWAGALGQPQFLPTVYLDLAQDFDGDGRRDIWSSLGDVFASIAAYLKEYGWTAEQGWGQEVRVTDAALAKVTDLKPRSSGCSAVQSMTDALPIAQWSEAGLRALDGKRLRDTKDKRSLVRTGKRAFLVTSNYEALLGYNCAHSYALSVALLSSRLLDR